MILRLLNKLTLTTLGIAGNKKQTLPQQGLW